MIKSQILFWNWDFITKIFSDNIDGPLEGPAL